MTTLDAKILEIERIINGYPDFDDMKNKCDEVNSLRVELAEIKGKMAVMTRLMWGIILALVGLLIQGAL